MEPASKTARRVWPYLLAIALIILVVVIGRNCRQDTGDPIPMYPDILDTVPSGVDTSMDPSDTGMTDPMAPNIDPGHGTGMPPGATGSPPLQGAPAP